METANMVLSSRAAELEAQLSQALAHKTSLAEQLRATTAQLTAVLQVGALCLCSGLGLSLTLTLNLILNLPSSLILTLTRLLVRVEGLHLGKDQLHEARNCCG